MSEKRSGLRHKVVHAGRDVRACGRWGRQWGWGRNNGECLKRETSPEDGGTPSPLGESGGRYLPETSANGEGA